jgi:hypothetical protein
MLDLWRIAIELRKRRQGTFGVRPALKPGLGYADACLDSVKP